MVKNKKFNSAKQAIVNPFAKIIAGMRNLMVSPKNAIARKVAMGSLVLSGLIYMIGCGDPANTCEYETDELNAAKTEETRLNDEFNANADSCLYNYGTQMPESWQNNAYGQLAEDEHTREDSVRVMKGKANSIISVVPEEDPLYNAVHGILRTGEKALALYTDFIPVAKSTTQIKQNALNECQAQH